MAKKAQRTGEYAHILRIRPSFAPDESLCSRVVEDADPYRGNVRRHRTGGYSPPAAYRRAGHCPAVSKTHVRPIDDRPYERMRLRRAAGGVGPCAANHVLQETAPQTFVREAVCLSCSFCCGRARTESLPRARGRWPDGPDEVLFDAGSVKMQETSSVAARQLPHAWGSPQIARRFCGIPPSAVGAAIRRPPRTVGPGIARPFPRPSYSRSMIGPTRDAPPAGRRGRRPLRGKACPPGNGPAGEYPRGPEN